MLNYTCSKVSAYGETSHSWLPTDVMMLVQIKVVLFGMMKTNKQQTLFLIKCYIIRIQTYILNTVNTYIYIHSEMQPTYKHSYMADTMFYFRHTHIHTSGRCEWPNSLLFYFVNPSLVHGKSTGRTTLNTPLSTHCSRPTLIQPVVALLCSPGGNESRFPV